ncbi:ATP-binding protein [Ructibacterium gallinarum]|uniref:histidine kinase n=1 Tax=Ructibacterium gallinarum TaxID=2779355 RepID=A0A9D5R878_9FIRM|nr:ATP-binding protein [Ructibacterium gallinarum]MBE5039189.1 HAMP domain-containing protein [Ructibacterium gallinarum]
MLKQLYWRLTGIVILTVLAAVLIAGMILFFGVTAFYTSQFQEDMHSVAESDLPQSIQRILTSQQEDTVTASQAEAAVNAFAGKLGLDENRSCFILSARDASVITPADMRPASMTVTPNLSAAMRAAKGDSVSLFGDYLDYALFIRNGSTEADGYILYIRDNKTEFHQLIRQMLFCLLWAMLAALLLSAAAGLLVTRHMASPLRQLTLRAERFASGDFEPALEKVPAGEMGELVRAFNHMGTVMNKSLQQINAEKHKIEVILEHINNGIIAFDTDQNMIHINPAAQRMFEIKDPSQLRFDRFFRSIGAGVCMAEFLYLERSKTEERDLLVGNNHIRASFLPFKIDNDKTAGIVCVFEDVTEQFNLEAARQKFVAEVSHELKTPLTTIRTYTETLLNGYLDDKKTAVSLLNTVQTETDKMTALVQNLLILSRFDMQRMDIRKSLFSIDDMLRRLENMFRLEAEKKGLELTYNRTTEIPAIYADQDQIERAVKNIISNSIKYCAKGDKIQIFAGSLYNNVYIKVEDSGKGIPKADLDHVFERFYRVDKARSRDKGGTGLGLSIAKEIIESHGGTIQIESEFGRFTRVTINLPMAKEN